MKPQTNTQTLHRRSPSLIPVILAHTSHVCHLQDHTLWLLFLLVVFFGRLRFLAPVEAGEAGWCTNWLSEVEQPLSCTVIGQRAELHLFNLLPLLAFLLQGQDFQQIDARLNRLDTLCAAQSDMGAASQRQ